MDKIYEKTLVSEIGTVRHAVSEAISFLHEHVRSFSGESEADVRLVLNEMLLNAVIHGNHSDASKRVHLRLELSGGAVIITVTDEGDGFDHGGLLAGFGNISVDSEHGRGVILSAALMDNFAYNEKGNQVVCSKKVTAYE